MQFSHCAQHCAQYCTVYPDMSATQDESARRPLSKTSVLQRFSSTFHWSEIEHAQLYRKLGNNNFVPRFPNKAAHDYCGSFGYDLPARIWRTKHR